MSISPKIEKKRTISSRTLQYNKRHIHDTKFDHAIQRQLEEDFKVHEYLNENPNDSHNTEKYIELINCLLLKKNTKKKQKLLLANHKKLSKINESLTGNQMETWGNNESNRDKADVYFTEEEYLKIKEELEAAQQIAEMKTKQEFEIKKLLIKEIVQNKKSLNLLKGDMGHMIGRNESISVLESKVSKVCLISENQLSKISLALAKDREEAQLREEMQKKFFGKLKNVESQAHKNLKKTNSSFLEAMQKRKYVYERLSHIEKECDSIEEYSEKLRQKEAKNVKSVSVFTFLCNVCDAIDWSEKLSLKLTNREISRKEYSEQLKNVLMSLLNVSECENADQQIEKVTKENLTALTEKIIKHFRKLELEIQHKRKQFALEIGSMESFWETFDKLQEEKSELNENYCDENRKKVFEERIDFGEYFKKFRGLESNFQVFYTLIDFMGKKLKKFNGAKLISQLYKNQMFHYKINPSDVLEETEMYEREIFNKLKQNFEYWFKDLQKVAKNSKKRRDSQQNKAIKMFLIKNQSPQSVDCLQITDNNHSKYINQTEKTEHDENAINLNVEEDSEEDEVEEIEEFGAMINDSKNNSPYSAGNKEQEEAKRVQVLVKIDKNYYNMIKETIQMEKDNTMKNYQFKQSFKRNKYSSQDDILEQKRFEATFSGFFKQDSDLSKTRTLISTPKLNSPKIANLEKIRPFATVHHNKSQKSIISSSRCDNNKKNINFWQQETKKKLGKKLKDILSKAEV